MKRLNAYNGQLDTPRSSANYRASWQNWISLQQTPKPGAYDDHGCFDCEFGGLGLLEMHLWEGRGFGLSLTQDFLQQHLITGAETGSDLIPPNWKDEVVSSRPGGGCPAGEISCLSGTILSAIPKQPVSAERDPNCILKEGVSPMLDKNFLNCAHLPPDNSLQNGARTAAYLATHEQLDNGGYFHADGK